MDIAQLPNLPEKTSESSESSDSESESKENSGRWKRKDWSNKERRKRNCDLKNKTVAETKGKKHK